MADLVKHIDTLDALAQTLSSCSPSLWPLHLALHHLRLEAADPDTLLNKPAYIDQLRALLDSCRRTLENADSPEFERRVKAQGVRVNAFLDKVQLSDGGVDVNNRNADAGLEDIKDKVDEVAKRVFGRRDSGFVDENGVWGEFKSELENEGFSRHVLKQHKDVLRAYIRGLESMSTQGGTPPSVRGLLEYEAGTNMALAGTSKEVVSNEKYSPSMKYRPEMPPKELPELFSERLLLPDAQNEGMALISTKDLVAMDSLSANMANMHLYPQYSAPPSQQYSASPNQHYLQGPPSPRLLGSSPQTYPPPQHFRLAPDSQGKEIPPDAQWTRINRDLVSPEVLLRAGVRYEARPSYVAVLGRLSKRQIEEFTRQSAEARAARASHGRYRRPKVETDSESESETDSEEDDIKDIGREPYIVSPPETTSPSATVKPKSILKNKNENHVRFDPEPHELGPESLGRSPRFESRSPRDRGTDRGDRGERRRRPRDSDRRYDERDYRPRRDEERRRRRKKWGQLGAAGAAVSLLTVLAEAATGM